MRRPGRVSTLGATFVSVAFAEALCFVTHSLRLQRWLGHHAAGNLAAPRRGRPRAGIRLAARARSSESWVLPRVDKDTDYFIEGRANSYAWMQTSETLYLFAPVPPQEDGGEGVKTKCAFELSEDGTHVRFDVAGTTVVQGRLSGGVKVGTEIWMIEDAPDGTQYVIAEVDKLKPGETFTSVIAPEVTFIGDYSQFAICLANLSPEQQDATVEETLQHLQEQHRSLQKRPDDHLAMNGDVLTVSLHGFELGPDGSRGAPLDIGGADGTKFELGGAGFLPEMHKRLVGIAVGEERDVKVTLKRGDLGGQQIVCAVTCQLIEEQVLPGLTDDFARELKRSEQMRLAATEDGVPWEEQGQAETFTIDDLRNEIANEIRKAAQEQEKESVESQLEEALLKVAEVDCEWASMGSQKQGLEGTVLDVPMLEKEELKSAVYHAFVEREDLLHLVDQDLVNRQTWHSLGTPKDGEKVAEVGNNPAREFQDAHRRTLRRHTREVALKWLEERAKVAAAA